VYVECRSSKVSKATKKYKVYGIIKRRNLSIKVIIIIIITTIIIGLLKQLTNRNR